MAKNPPPSKDRRDVGQVVFLSEKMANAREFSSCCVGVEAALDSDQGFKALLRKLSKPGKSSITD